MDTDKLDSYVIVKLNVFSDKNKEMNNIDNLSIYYPEIVGTVDTNDYKFALNTTINYMHSHYKFLLDSENEILEVCYPIKITDKISSSFRNGTFFNRETNYINAVEIFNSKEYLDTIMNSKIYEELNKCCLESTPFFYLVDNLESVIKEYLENRPKI